MMPYETKVVHTVVNGKERTQVLRPGLPGMDVEREVTLTDAERRAVLRILHEANPDEDVIGQIMYFGGFHELSGEDGDILRLAMKLEGRDPE